MNIIFIPLYARNAISIKQIVTPSSITPCSDVYEVLIEAAAAISSWNTVYEAMCS